jgi:hypothetical protein
MNIMDAITKKKFDRFRFLNRLYEITDGDYNKFKLMWSLGEELNLSRDETLSVMNYLNTEGLARYFTLDGAVGITHTGVIEVERALSKPDTPTQYFPPVINILHVQSMVGSQIQQGSSSSTQTQSQSITQNDLNEIGVLLSSIKQNLTEIGLTGDANTDAEAEIQTIEAQLRSSKPKSAILRESFKTLRNLIEGVASNAVAAGVLPLFAPVAAILGF